MKRKLVVLALLVSLIGFAAFAGPTLGIGIGYYPATFYFAPSLGIQWLGIGGWSIGVESTMHLGLIALETGPELDFELDLGGFWEVLILTFPLMQSVNGGGARLNFGVGTPFFLDSDTNAFTIDGDDLGWVGGVSFEGPGGSGWKVLGYYNGDLVGVGVGAYWDTYRAMAGGE